MNKNIVVVALGGNALVKPGQKGEIEEMRTNVRQALENIFPLVEQGNRLVITHGNGPQVGVHLLKEDAGKQVYETPVYPLDVLVADTQGEIGYLIESEWRNLAMERQKNIPVASLVSMVEVSEDDPAFQNPVKRVGVTYYDWEDVEKFQSEKNWIFKEEIKNGEKGWRRVVPSPVPQKIVNIDAVKQLLENDFVVISAGGGGISVVHKNGKYRPVEAVIDKDLASSVLAEDIQASSFIILTDVPNVYIHYGTPQQQALYEVSVKELDKWIAQKAFGEGNMLPKVLAAKKFTEQSGQPSIITDFQGLKNGKGTVILP